MRCVVLEYHDVVPGEDYASSGFVGDGANTFKLPAARFDAHLQAIDAVPAALRTSVMALGQTDQPAPVLLTFDDGGASALSEIAPRLEAHGWRGHFFIPTDALDRPGFLSSAGVRELAARGHVLGSHSASHPLRIAALPALAVREEWTRSCGRLGDILGVPVTVASVPGGMFSWAVADAAAAAGIRWLFTSEPVVTVQERSGCLVIGRYTLKQRARPAEVAQLALGQGTARVKQWLEWNSKKVAKRLAGPAYMSIRKHILGD